MRPGFHACRSLALTTTSPPRRGSSGGLPVADQHRRVVPAHAGVIRGSTFSAQHCWVVPAQAASSVGQRYPHPDLVVPAQARVIRSRPARSGRWIVVPTHAGVIRSTGHAIRSYISSSPANAGVIRAPTFVTAESRGRPRPGGGQPGINLPVADGGLWSRLGKVIRTGSGRAFGSRRRSYPGGSRQPLSSQCGRRSSPPARVWVQRPRVM